jgi:REP element-mobilizing transposase RayT
MTPFDYRHFYRRNLPHIHSPGSTMFTTFRLADSIPGSVVSTYRNERILKERELKANPELTEFYREWFLKFDAILDNAMSGPTWLAIPKIRSVVYDKLLKDDVSKYRLDAFSIMSNHAHAVFRPNLDERSLSETRIAGRPGFESDQETLAEIMQSIKGVTARDCNRLLNRRGQFWEYESFDREVRNEEGFIRAVRYTLRNPVKAGLVNRPMDWPGNFLAQRLLDDPRFENLVG